MKRKIALLLVITILLGVVSGCSKNNEINEVSNEINTSAETKIITDNFGFEVEIPTNIERVAIVWLLPLPSVLAVYQGGYVDNLVGMPPDSLNAAQNSILASYAPDILNVETNFYEGGELNLEELLNLNPDVIFYTGEARAEIFKNAGIPAVGFGTAINGDSNPITVLNGWIELLEEVFGEESKTKGIIEYANEVQEEIQSRVATLSEDEKKKVLMIGHYTDSAITPGGFSDYWCEMVGAISVSKGATGEVNMEQVYEWNPDVIFLSTLAQFYPQNIYDNTAGTGHDWSTVSAVENEAVYKFPLGMHRWWPPSSDAPLSLWWIAIQTYPELFEDIDMNEKVREYYSEFYGMDLTDDEIDGILNPIENLGRKYY